MVLDPCNPDQGIIPARLVQTIRLYQRIVSAEAWSLRGFLQLLDGPVVGATSIGVGDFLGR